MARKPAPEAAAPVDEAVVADAPPADTATEIAPLPADEQPPADEELPAIEPLNERSGFVLRVRALQPSRWRIGRQFGPEPVEIAAADLTEAEIMALMQDTALTVDVIAPE
ncbi:MAG: hypothetical protein ACK4L4_07750 [Gemmobacter sp.]